MNSPNTPVHIHLWHRDFWLMTTASLLLSMSVYALLPVMPLWLMHVENFTPGQTGLSMGAFGAGLYLFGATCSWLVQHYRRNVVCLWAMAAVAAGEALLWHIDSLRSEFVEFWVILLQRFLLGAFFGLAQMVLASTLIIDTCEASQRTAANHWASWVSRFALASGPLAGLSAYGLYGFNGVVLGAVGLAVAALLMVKLVNFPFRTPEENIHVVSLDRFFMPHGTVLFLNFMLVSTVVGMLLTMPFDSSFYVLLAAGFALAWLAQYFMFREAELESEIVTGLFLLLAAQLVLWAYPTSRVTPVLIGLGTGVIAARFLLFFIKLSRHCQRGTSQSTFFLGWESGLALGVAIGYGLFFQQPAQLLSVSLLLTACALVMYHLYTHRWFVTNKNR